MKNDKKDENGIGPKTKPEHITPSNETTFKNVTTPAVVEASLSEGDPDMSEADISAMMSEVIQ